MGAVEQLEGVNFIEWLIIGLLILSAIIAIYKIVCEFLSIIGKPIGTMKQRKDDHELLVKTVEDLKVLHDKHEEDTRQSIIHDEAIRNDLKTLTATVNSIADNLDDMKKKNNETKVKELKDMLIGYYNKYRVIGEWSKLEKDAFWELFEDYEKRGGNGYIHTIVEPVMRELREID